MAVWVDTRQGIALMGISYPPPQVLYKREAEWSARQKFENAVFAGPWTFDPPATCPLSAVNVVQFLQCPGDDVSDCTAILKSIFEGVDYPLWFPKGRYRISKNGSGVAVNWTKPIQIYCHPEAEFYSDGSVEAQTGLDAGMLRFSIPDDYSGPKLSFKWVGGYLNGTGVKNSGNNKVPFANDYLPANPGTSQTCDLLSVRPSNASGVNMATEVYIGFLRGFAGSHWQVGGADSVAFLGAGADMTIFEKNWITGARDLGLYFSGTYDNPIIIQNNLFVNCFYGASIKRGAKNFVVQGNRFDNCVGAFIMSLDTGGNGRFADGAIYGNMAVGCTLSFEMQDCDDVACSMNTVRNAGALDNYGQPVSVIPLTAYDLSGAVRCQVSLNVANGIRAEFTNATPTPIAGNMFRLSSSNGTGPTIKTGYGTIAQNRCFGWNRLGFCDPNTTEFMYIVVNGAQNVLAGGVAFFSGLDASSYEERLDPTDFYPVINTPNYYGNGTSALPIIARATQKSTGIWFAANKIGLSVNGSERLSISGSQTTNAKMTVLLQEFADQAAAVSAGLVNNDVFRNASSKTLQQVVI